MAATLKILLGLFTAVWVAVVTATVVAYVAALLH